VKAKALALALLLGSATLAGAQEAPKPSPFTFALHGFVSMSACLQDGAYQLSDCQQSIMAAAEPAADESSLGFDVRQSRFNFSVKGPQVFFGATPSAVLEIDFFQGFGGGAFGNVSLLNRMRLAYSELSWGNHRLAFGQLNDLTFAMAPVSLSHIAFPLGYETGNIGWRRPGIWGFHNLPFSSDLKLELAWMVGRSQWNDAAASIGAGFPDPATNPGGITRATASATPALEGRATVTFQKLLNAWVAGHWNKVDLNGVGTGGGDDITVQAVNGGAKVTFGPATVAATGFVGKNLGPLVSNLVQFNLRPGNGDVSVWGWWAQAGYNVTKELSAWALFGQQKPDEQDAKAAQMARLENQTTNVILQYRDGGYGVSAEWVNFKTTNATYDAGTGAFTGSSDANVNQYIATATYFF
jgi:hypothetical protein